MVYQGSKNRIAKFLVPIIQKYIDANNIKTYVEPMVGGANVIDKIKCERKIGADKQEYLIALYQNLHRLNELPDFVTKEHYSEVRDCFKNQTETFEKWYIGAIGFLASYNGRFFDGGYSGVVTTKSGVTRNYYDEAKRNLETQLKNLKNIEWESGDYKDTCSKFENCLIYCDPPYKGTKQYNSSKNFDYDEFWDWCYEMSKNNIVLVSEYNSVKDFECIWEQEVKRTINNNHHIKSIERLFKIKS